MKMFRNCAFLIMTTALASGCTTQLSTRPDLVKTAPNEALPGIAYNLPMLQYRLDVTRGIEECPHDVIMILNEKAKDGKLKEAGRISFIDPRLNLSTDVKASPQYVRGETYVIDYRTLSSMLKQTSFGMKLYPETGNLKGINISAEDKSADVIKDVAKLGISVVALASGVPVIPAVAGAGDSGGAGAGVSILAYETKSISSADGAAEQRKQDFKMLAAAVNASKVSTDYLACSDELKAILAQNEFASAEVKRTSEELTAATVTLRNATMLAAISGLSKQSKADYVASLSDALADVDVKTMAAADSVKTRDKLKGKIMAKQSHVWPSRLDEIATTEPFASTKTREAFGKYLSVQNSAQIIDIALFARNLRDLPADVFGRLAKDYDFLMQYRNASVDETDVKAPKNIAATCGARTGNLSQSTCLDDKLKLFARLDPVEFNEISPAGAANTNTPACATSPGNFPVAACTALVAPAEKKKAEVVDARGHGDGATFSKGGLFVRQAIPGRLMICEKEACNANLSENLIETEADAKPQMAPQLGQLRFLPFKNTSFQSNELVLDLAEDGSISNFEYKDKAAIAAQMAATAADVAGQIRDARDKRREETAKAAATAEGKPLADLKAEIDLLENRAKLIELKKTKPEAEKQAEQLLTDIKAETALLDAKLARQKAYNDLIAASAATISQ